MEITATKKQAPAFLSLSEGGFSRSAASKAIRDGVESATLFDIIHILRSPDIPICPQIEQVLRDRFVWIFPEIKDATPGWNTIDSDKRTSTPTPFNSFLWGHFSNSSLRTQVHFSKQAVKDIKEGLPVGLYFGYDSRITNKIISRGLKALSRMGPAPPTTDEENTKTYHEKIMLNWFDTSYAKFRCTLRVEGGKGWAEDQAPMIFVISDPNKIASIERLFAAMQDVKRLGIPPEIEHAVLRDALRKARIKLNFS